jgi:hypothetical protein
VEEVNWFVGILKDKFHVQVTHDQVGYEGTELYVDEIDESLIPKELLETMPEALLFETMLVCDEEGTEWLGVVALHPETNEWCLQVILKEGEPVMRELVEKENEQ